MSLLTLFFRSLECADPLCFFSFNPFGTRLFDPLIQATSNHLVMLMLPSVASKHVQSSTASNFPIQLLNHALHMRSHGRRIRLQLMEGSFVHYSPWWSAVMLLDRKWHFIYNIRTVWNTYPFPGRLRQGRSFLYSQQRLLLH